jgi:hypothetical protein
VCGVDGAARIDHDADTWLGFDPDGGAIDSTGSKITKAGSQSMTAVGSDRNKPQNALAGNHCGSLNRLGAEALDQVPFCEGRLRKRRQFTDVSSWTARRKIERGSNLRCS